MDWSALAISLKLALMSALILMPLALGIAKFLTWQRSLITEFVQVIIMLPLVLPPTVLGYYLLQLFGSSSPIGQGYTAITGGSLPFSFAGLVLTLLIVNLPFAVLPIQHALTLIPKEYREAAWCSGLSRWQTLLKVELPLIWPSMLAATVLVAIHALGEFGASLMIGGNIPGETQTIAIAIYDKALSFDEAAAAKMSLLLMLISVTAILALFRLNAYLFSRSR